MFDLQNFSLAQMTRLGSNLRTLGKGAASMEEVGNRIVRHLYTDFLAEPGEQRECVLVRLFVTQPYGALDETLRQSADGMLGGATATAAMKCLVLLATVGDKPEWNLRTASAGHKAIPLPSEKSIENFPMISQLVVQLGLDPKDLLRTAPTLLMDSEKSFNVFHVPEAQGSPYVPAQAEFVIPQKIRSVLGFGGLLPPAELFAVILFARVPIPRETAELFRTLALNVKIALIPFTAKVFH